MAMAQMVWGELKSHSAAGTHRPGLSTAALLMRGRWFSLLKYFVMSLQNQPTKLVTLDDVKNCISFPKGSLKYDCLMQICEIGYKMAKEVGASEEQSVRSAADALGEALDKMKL